MAKGLTNRQKEILEYIQGYVEEKGYPPSIREIGKQFAIGSLRGVTVHLDALHRKEYISRSNTPRSIKVVHPQFQPSDRIKMLPLLGSIAAGAPILAQEHIEEWVAVPTELVRNIEDAFMLRIRGDSMTGEGILDQDMVVVRPYREVIEGELVAALLGDEATVKRVHFDKRGVMLMPSNPDYLPIPVDREDSMIIGKIIGLFRDYPK